MDAPRVYELWENESAPNRGSDYEQIKSRGYPYDKDWEYHSYPLGNGYIGACLFGRTDTERVQITDKTLHVEGPYANNGGLSNFAELYLDFGHENVKDYRRALNLNHAMATVSYESGGVRYHREYFVSYPDRVLVIRLTADKPKSLSFKVRPQIPYVNAKEPGNRRTATTVVKDDLILLSGTTAFFSCNFEAQVKVLNEGGTLSRDEERITVSDADGVTLLLASGTNYRLGPHIFLNAPAKKLDPTLYPHEEVSGIIRLAIEKGYAALKADHLADYQHLFNRVAVNLNSSPSPLPTSRLLAEYQQGKRDTWLEELMFQYGRYLLIASSREKSLPANLQGTWSQYEVTPWSGGYWHNINVQMNYWGAMSANLAETFEAYLAYFNAYLPKAREHARNVVRKRNPDLVAENEDYGWIVGTGASAYHIGGPGGHSGPGTGGFTSKLLMDYFLFTGDRTFLEEVAYPAMLSLSRFYASTLVPHGDLLLVEPSASPENRASEAQLNGMPGQMTESGHYVTAGCTFDQGFVWENFNDTLILAKFLGKQDPFLKTIEEQMAKLDPILIGTSGQIKEYREENAYSDLGDPKHRHISHLCPLYPGTLINSSRPEWMRAAMKTLDLRGDKTTGWAIAHRMNCRARLKQGDKAHELYARLLAEKTTPNLWTLHPPFQIDANFGAMAGVVEMLLQSHKGGIELLPALPGAWPDGHIKGVRARGDYTVDIVWRGGTLEQATITAGPNAADGPVSVVYKGRAISVSLKPGASITLRGEIARELDFGARVRPLPAANRFAEDGRFVWCGAPVRGEDGKYHLFYSRWPVKAHFVPGWAIQSEIAYAVADHPAGPYRHVNVALPARGINPNTGEKYWDGDVTHNPNILLHKSTYYLYYTGNHGDGKNYAVHRNNQRVGLATATHPAGPWKRLDKPIIDISPDRSDFDSLCVMNPAACLRPDGGILLVYKAATYLEGKEMGGNVRHGVVLADRPGGPYHKQRASVFEAKDSDAHWMLVEDPFVWFSRKYGHRYYALARDVVGTFSGAKGGICLFASNDGLDWRPAAHPRVLGATVPLEGGGTTTTHLERPVVLLEHDEPVYLFGADDGYEPNGRLSTNIQIPLAP